VHVDESLPRAVLGVETLVEHQLDFSGRRNRRTDFIAGGKFYLIKNRRINRRINSYVNSIVFEFVRENIIPAQEVLGEKVRNLRIDIFAAEVRARKR